MQELDDITLLRQYTEHNSVEAFATLVTRHVNKVYSVALRHTRNPHQAEEITQAVFVIFARKAKQMRQHAVLSGWFYQTARLTAVTFIRSEIRRTCREQEAYMQSTLNENESETWTQIAPLLDAAMAGLNETDRHAVVLRFFDGKSMGEVGAALGASEGAAKMRVNRAMEKLRQFFVKRGIASTTATLAGAISANSVQAAPAGLAAVISSTALSGTTITTAALIAATKAIAMTTFQKTIITAALATTIGTGIFEAHQAAQLRAQNQSSQQQQASLTAQVQQLSQLLTDATNQLAGLVAENAQLKSNSNELELLNLRGEVSQLRTANAQNDSNDPTDEAAKSVAARVKQMKQWLEQNPNDNIPELQYLTAQEWLRGASYSRDWQTDDDFDRALSQLRRDAKRTFANSIGDALANYIAGNNGQLPGDISQLGSYFNPPVDETILQRYQLLQTGNLSDIPNNEPLIAEKAPVDDQYDTLFTISATGYSYQGTGTSWVNGSGKGSFGPNITAKIKPFEGK
jgi:RNA polymerase sigma factor (sigma-70 family)